MDQKATRRSSPWLPAALPIMDPWYPQPGDQAVAGGVSGDPRDKKTSLKHAIVLPKHFDLGPMFLSDYISCEKLTKPEKRALQVALGVPGDRAVWDQLEWGVRQLTGAITLRRRLPSWGDFETRLTRIIKVGRLCVKARNTFIKLVRPDGANTEAPEGVVSLETIVKAFINHHRTGSPQLLVDIDSLLKVCKDALPAIKEKASKRGPKEEFALKQFVEAALAAARLADVALTLPSNEMKGVNGAPQTTPTFTFIRAALNIACSKAIHSVTTLSISNDEKNEATRTLRSYQGKSDGALLEIARQAKTALMARPTRK